MQRKKGAESVRVSPFTVLVDTREQAPFRFQNIGGTRFPLLIPTKTATLQSGDYSIDGHELRVAVERKSIEDLYSTLTHGRERFVRELERLREFDFSTVVVEADWHAVAIDPPFGSNVRPKSITSSIIALGQQFPKTHWHLFRSRRLAEVMTYRILERYWIETVEKPAKEQRRLARMGHHDHDNRDKD